MTSNTFDFAKSTVSHPQNRDNLWNVVEPGDPYDIRRFLLIYSGP